MEYGLFVNLGWVPLDDKSLFTVDDPVKPIVIDENKIS